MSAFETAEQVKYHLAKTNAKHGNGTSAIFLNKKVYSAGGTPINPPTETITPILLFNAVVSKFDRKLIDNDLIRSSDKRLVADGDVEIVDNDEIDVNGVIHAVIGVDVEDPLNVPLAYIAQLRSQ